MLDIVLYQYKNKILKKRAIYIKATILDKIAEVFLIIGAGLMIVATILELIFKDTISLWVMTGGLVMIFIGVLLVIISAKIYFKCEKNIMQEKKWEEERIKELKEYLKENFQIMDHEEKLQFLIDECEQKSKVSSENILFSGVIGFFVGILSLIFSSMIDDLSKNIAEGQRWLVYILIILFVGLIILVLFGFGIFINSFREKQINVLNSLQRDLKYILLTCNTCKKTENCTLNGTGADTYRKNNRKKK